MVFLFPRPHIKACMNVLLHQLIEASAEARPNAEALSYRGDTLNYAALQQAVADTANGLQALGLKPGERVAIYLPKQLETVIALFAVARAGGIFVPVNPLLKPPQVAHILSDSGASLLITSKDRASLLHTVIDSSQSLHQVVIVDGGEDVEHQANTVSWQQLRGQNRQQPTNIDAQDSVAILYTSGSTGHPKGVELTHRNLVLGAQSVAQYLAKTPDDRLLAVLPFSFDYGLSQLTTAFHSGASVVLMEYLLPREVINTIARERITGLAGVPSLWAQLAQLDWPEDARNTLRFITNSGGAMPQSVLSALQNNLPETEFFLMYGLTEAFRSTYLSPHELQRRPSSIGKAIPHAHVSVVREDGTPCIPGEPGELVHAGPLVAKGYWNNPQGTAERFRSAPDTKFPVKHKRVVWSGDTVTMDEDGFLYFVGRADEQIKTSGYRVSPTEVEDVLDASGLVREAAVISIPHDTLGQAIVAFVQPVDEASATVEDDLRAYCKRTLPAYMLPQHIVLLSSLPKTPHGKIDRKRLAEEFGVCDVATVS